MVLPLADDNRARRTVPWLTYLLLAINVAAFVSLAVADPARQAAVFDSYALVPARVLHGGPSAWLTLVTCTFLHASWAHLAGNMLFLWIFGDNVEDAFGHLRYLVFYLLGGVLASVTQLLIDPTSTTPVVGASGAIAAVLAAYVVLFPHGGVRTLVVLVPPFFVWPVLPAWLLIGGWFLLQFWSGLHSLGALATGGVAYWAHVGGFVVGLFLARPMARRGGVEHRLATVKRR
jgi:membrane associated rhomboid family serine protease